MAGAGVDHFVAQVKRAVDSKDAPGLASLLDFNERTSSYKTLRQALTSGPSFRATSYASLSRSFFGDAPQRPWADLVAAYLLFVRDADWSTTDTVAADSTYQLAEDCFRASDKVFSQGDSGYFVPTLRACTNALVSLGLRAGRISGDAQFTKASDAATLFRRPMTIAGSDKSTESPSKRDAIFFLANATFKVYFALSNLRLCDTILKNTGSSVALLHTFPKADRVAFHYNRGRISLYQRKLTDARQDLKMAFDLCHCDSYHNGRLILIYLIVASLPLGFFPSEELLEQFDLQEQFGELLPSLQLGDYRGVFDCSQRVARLASQEGQLPPLARKVGSHLLAESSPTNIHLIAQPASGPPTLPFDSLLKTARISFDDSSLDLDDVECMAASLAEQGYIKAYIMHSKRLLVLQKGPLVGFPAVAQVHPV